MFRTPFPASFILFGLALLTPPGSLAQTPATRDAELPPVTVSASGLNSTNRDMATPVSVLTGDELVRRRAATLGETLQAEPGVHAGRFGAGASRPIIRGMDGPRVRVLSDGAEVMDASQVSPDHAVAVEPMLSRQIEVLRGPSALVYGGGAIGGVVNVLDERVPTAVPENGFAGSLDLRGATAARERAGAFSVTGGAGNFALHLEGLARDASDYRTGSGWTGGKLVHGSFNQSDSTSIGASLVGTRGYIGLALSSQRNRYGLPGHAHEYEGCHADGDQLHCGDHDDDDADADADADADHDHDHEGGGEVPRVKLRSDRWDLRGDLRDPLAGFSRLRLRGSFTDYRHDEIEGGEIGTTFRNEAYDGRVELEHRPLAGWRGLVGLQGSRRKFSALGDEAYVQPSDTRRQALFVLEEYRLTDWRFELAARQEWQRIDIDSDKADRRHRGTSASAGASWRVTPGYLLSASLTRAQRLPTAEELYADGLHLATRTYERGNADLKPETSTNLDLQFRKTAGRTRFTLGTYYNRVRGYIHARTLDELDGLQLIEYTQRDARFLGFEAQLRQALGEHFALTLNADHVRARLQGGEGNLPRTPASRLGARLDAAAGDWDAFSELQYVTSQRRVAQYESATPGYTLVNVGLGWSLRAAGLEHLFYARIDNLTDRVATTHTSFIKDAAPLAGRSLVLGLRSSF